MMLSNKAWKMIFIMGVGYSIELLAVYLSRYQVFSTVTCHVIYWFSVIPVGFSSGRLGAYIGKQFKQLEPFIGMIIIFSAAMLTAVIGRML